MQNYTEAEKNTRRNIAIVIVFLFASSCCLLISNQFMWAIFVFGLAFVIGLLFSTADSAVSMTKQKKALAEHRVKIETEWANKLAESIRPLAISPTQAQTKQLELLINSAHTFNLNSFKALIELVEIRSHIKFDELQAQTANGIIKIFQQKDDRSAILKELLHIKEQIDTRENIEHEKDASDVIELHKEYETLYNSADQTTKTICDLLWSIRRLQAGERYVDEGEYNYLTHEPEPTLKYVRFFEIY